MRALELHLLEYKQKMLEYLRCLETRHVSDFRPNPLQPFSTPFDTKGYDDHCITDDLITDLFLEFSERTRKKESEEFQCTLSGQLIVVCEISC